MAHGNLISLACNLVDPLCERGTIVACEAKWPLFCWVKRLII